MAGRRVVLLCGPPGAGKTTVANQSGLIVYDRDDPQWQGEAHFRRALDELGRDRRARAVVVRQGATSSARAKNANLIGATEIYLLTAPVDELTRRVAHRGRDVRREVAGIRTWFARHDRTDNVRDFPGWNLTGDAAMVRRGW